MTVLTAVWGWLKTKWQWVLLGVLVVSAYVAGRRRSLPIPTSNEKKAEVEEKTRVLEEQAAAAKEEKITDLRIEHDNEVHVVEVREAERVEEIRSNPATETEAVNDFLKNVGRNVRN